MFMILMLALLILVYNVAFTLLRLKGGDLSLGVQLLYQAAFICGFGWCLERELRKRKVKPLYCEGLLLQTGWLIVIPYYLWKARGKSSLIPLAILISAFIVAQFIAALIYAFST